MSLLEKLLAIFAVLSLLYGIAVRGAGSGSAFYIVWILLAAFLAAFAFLLHGGQLAALPKAVKIIGITALAIGITAVGIVEGFIISDMSTKCDRKLDYVIVLGAQVKKSGPSLSLRRRLDTAYDYLEQNPETVCIVSGGKGSNEPMSEAECMQKYLIEKGIAKERIIEENKSTNTKENLQNSLPMIESGKSIALITNDFHVHRAKLIAKNVGYSEIYGIAADSPTFYLPNNMLREFFALIKFAITN